MTAALAAASGGELKKVSSSYISLHFISSLFK
jgi:hypothetical protein